MRQKSLTKWNFCSKNWQNNIRIKNLPNDWLVYKPNKEFNKNKADLSFYLDADPHNEYEPNKNSVLKNE